MCVLRFSSFAQEQAKTFLDDTSKKEKTIVDVRNV